MNLEPGYTYIVDDHTGWILRVVGRACKSLNGREVFDGLSVHIVIPSIKSSFGFIDAVTLRTAGRYRSLNATERVLYGLKSNED